MLIVSVLLSAMLSGEFETQLVERVRYYRPSGKELVLECEFTFQRTETGTSIESVTGRGKSRLLVSSHHDRLDRLTGAEVRMIRDERKIAATVTVLEGKARVQRVGQDAQEFEVPPGVIVTSAPDWTDTFLLCRRYDQKQGGKQSYPGLWIHPEQASQRLTFAIERAGEDTIDYSDKKLKLGRFTIWLRGNTSYTAWVDESGKMIKLVPRPYKETALNWLVLEGYEKSTSELWPPVPRRDD